MIIIPIHLYSQEKKKDYHIIIPCFEDSPKIDGHLEEKIWKKGAVIENFTQFKPREGAEPTEKTIVYCGYNRNNLYIAIRAFDSNPEAIRACLTQRDNVYEDDEIIIYIDTFHDKKRAFTFQVNPCGVQTDGIYNETKRRRRGGGFSKIDKNWDTFFLTDATIDDKGYMAEMAIPFKSLRFPNRKTQIWGFQITRKIQRKNEEVYWYPRSRDVDGFLIQAGTIEIQGDIETGKNIEVMPVFTGLKQRGEKFDPEVGANLKYGVTSNLTLDATINPDFSQIEADMPQIDVNQRYELYYPEKRPFFLESKDYFDTPLELIYTRRIINPLWGAKLTGKIKKTTIGFFSIYDETPSEININESINGREEVYSNKGWVNVFRFKRELYPESHIGLILTDKEVGTSWSSISSNYNRVLGVDGHFKFKKYYRLSFQAVGSQSKVLTDKTKLVPAGQLEFSRKSRHLDLTAGYTGIHPDFEASSGFLRRKDIHSFNTRMSYIFLPQNDFVVEVRPFFEYKRIYDFNQILTDEELQIGGFLSGWRNSFIWANFQMGMERYEGVDFRKKSFRTHLNSNPFSWLSCNFSFSFGDGLYYDENPYLGWKTSIGTRLTLKPFSFLRIFYNFRNNRFFETRGGEKVYEINIMSQRINLQISRTVSLRLITDYNDYYKELYLSFLFSYEYRPGTVFYFGIEDNQGQDELGMYRIEGRYIFVKFSYWWRI
ncbi:MAG: DUF5916 domain-containing protein [Candidatus Aminicenantaceae bacterium]